MATTKEYDNKLHSLRNTEKMTRTMKLVSMSKLYRAQEDQRKASVYARELSHLISRLSASVREQAHPLLTSRPDVKNVLILMFTSDKGLCAGFNNNMIKFVKSWIMQNNDRYENIMLSFCGKRGYAHFKKGNFVENYYEGVTNRPDFDNAVKISLDLAQHFVNGDYDEVYLAYNTYISALSQRPTISKLLPIDPAAFAEETEKEESPNAEYLFEPPKEQLLQFLIPKYIYFKVYYTLLENAAGEHGARMTAMDSATKNAGDLIDKFTLLRNRARQAAITTELIEIVSGAEALK